jgi:hypothetical protein
MTLIKNLDGLCLGLGSVYFLYYMDLDIGLGNRSGSGFSTYMIVCFDGAYKIGVQKSLLKVHPDRVFDRCLGYFLSRRDCTLVSYIGRSLLHGWSGETVTE